MNFIAELEKALQHHRNAETALPMENYMKNKFSFLGIKAEMRREIMKSCYPNHTQEIKANFREICKELFHKKEREYHLIAIDLPEPDFPKTTKFSPFFTKKLKPFKTWLSFPKDL